MHLLGYLPPAIIIALFTVSLAELRGQCSCADGPIAVTIRVDFDAETGATTGSGSPPSSDPVGHVLLKESGTTIALRPIAEDGGGVTIRAGLDINTDYNFDRRLLQAFVDYYDITREEIEFSFCGGYILSFDGALRQNEDLAWSNSISEGSAYSANSTFKLLPANASDSPSDEDNPGDAPQPSSSIGRPDTKADPDDINNPTSYNADEIVKPPKPGFALHIPVVAVGTLRPEDDLTSLTEAAGWEYFGGSTGVTVTGSPIQSIEAANQKIILTESSSPEKLTIQVQKKIGSTWTNWIRYELEELTSGFSYADFLGASFDDGVRYKKFDQNSLLIAHHRLETRYDEVSATEVRSAVLDIDELGGEKSQVESVWSSGSTRLEVTRTWLKKSNGTWPTNASMASASLYQWYEFGEARTKQWLYPNGLIPADPQTSTAGLLTQWTYYTDTLMGTLSLSQTARARNHGRIRDEISYEGWWSRTFVPSDSQVKVYRPWLDGGAAPSNTEAGNELTTIVTAGYGMERKIDGVLVASSNEISSAVIPDAEARDGGQVDTVTSLTIYYAATGPYYRRGRVQYREVTEAETGVDVKSIEYTYTLGNWNAATKTFTASATGSFVRTIATQYPDVDASVLPNQQRTRDITIKDAEGKVMASWTDVQTNNGSWSTMTFTQRFYDARGRLVEVRQDDLPIARYAYPNALTTKMKGADGVEIITYYTSEGTVDYVVTNGITTTTREYGLDAGGYQRETKEVAGTLTRTTTSNFDAADRLVSDANAQGYSTSYAYDYTSQPGVKTTITHPNGSTTIDTTYRDGQLKSVSGTAELATSYTYGVINSGTDTGLQWKREQIGSSRWNKIYTDSLGNTRRVERPALNGTTSTTAVVNHDYLYNGQLWRTTRPSNDVAVYNEIRHYDLLGRPTLAGLDGNADKSIVTTTGADRGSKTSRKYEQISSRWYAVEEVLLLDETSTGSYVTTSIVESKTSVSADGNNTSSSATAYTANVTGELRKTIRIDGAGFTDTTTETVATATAKRTVTTDRTGVSNNQITVYKNGRLFTHQEMYQTSPTTYYYDGLGRQIGVKDPTTGRTTGWFYNTIHQLEYIVEHIPGVTAASDILSVLPATQDYKTKYVYYTSGTGKGRVSGVHDAEGQTTLYTYTAKGQVATIRGTGQKPVDYIYDSAYGDLIELRTYYTFPGTYLKRTWQYEAASGLLRAKTGNSLSSKEEFEYYPSGALKVRENVRNARVTYTYTAYGDLKKIDYPDTATPDVTYTAHYRSGRPKTITDGAGTKTLTYDLASGGVTGETYTSGLLNGVSVSRGFSSGRLNTLSASWSGATIPGLTHTYSTITGLHDAITRTGTTIKAAYRYRSSSAQVTERIFTNGGGERLRTILDFNPQNQLRAISNQRGGRAFSSHVYRVMDKLHRRKIVDREDGTQWHYAYNTEGELIKAGKYRNATEPLAGYQFRFTFDDASNREQRSRGGNATEGGGLITESYSTSTSDDIADQYSQVTHSPAFDILGQAGNPASVTVTTDISGTTTEQVDQSPWWRQRLTHTSSSSPRWGEATVSHALDSRTGDYYLPPGTETLSYDADGNLSGDARWTYTWDNQNRLIKMETKSAVITAGAPNDVLEFTYDGVNRRVRKKFIRNGSTVYDEYYLYDGWNIIGRFRGWSGTKVPIQKYAWGLDASGTLHGAGGVGGLLWVEDAATTTTRWFPAYDGNGNVMALLEDRANSATAGYLNLFHEYGPFGESLSKRGVMDSFGHNCPFQFSTKWTDEETGLIYYGHRYYDPKHGRWLSRDPIGEGGGVNLYGFVGNDGVNRSDYLGLYTLANAEKSLKDKGVEKEGSVQVPDWTVGGTMGGAINYREHRTYYFYTDTQIFDEWLVLEKADTAWLNNIPDCPDKIRCLTNGKPKNCNNGVWKELEDGWAVQRFHPHADYCMRSKAFARSAQQCCYKMSEDKKFLELIKKGRAAGTPDRVATGGVFGSIWSFLATSGHYAHDVLTYTEANTLGRISDYLDVRPPSQGGGKCYAE